MAVTAHHMIDCDGRLELMARLIAFKRIERAHDGCDARHNQGMGTSHQGMFPMVLRVSVKLLADMITIRILARFYYTPQCINL